MPFDQSTRSALAKMVGDCRRLLTDDIRKQLQGTYGLQPDGIALPPDALGHLDERHREIARELREWQAHLAANEVGTDAKQRATERMTRETAFTALNRLAALRLCEERGHVIECVRRGMASDGFQLFERLTGGALGARGETYRLFLDRMFDELALDLGALFDRRDARSLIFPDEQCLEHLLALLTASVLSHLWQEDETIGWIYQYFNDPAERKKMRESAAPRNSYELAVRNQFFTPRYVVEFLTDNTLGRTWYEVTRGETRLTDQCRYLVRRPNEIFLEPGEFAPAGDAKSTARLSQEELLEQPDYIPHRPLKDPRTILMLDPACGSMHFGLYAFDLFEIIYNEAWELEDRLGAGAPSRPPGMKSLHDTYAAKDAFLKDVPRLIIEHNIHGIDIDPRCAQIAGLSLWLRAQKSWQRIGLKAADRPPIKRSNIVCAEPMPGERELLREFVDREFSLAEHGVFVRLLEAVFAKMQLAGEAGSLLKIEEEIRNGIAEAKKLWSEAPKIEQAWLFPGAEPPGPKQMKLDLSGITDEQFWERAEGRIYTALRDYAERAEERGGFQRRLFAEDAARGFAFIDVCRKRYDIALMNPPFGEVSPGARQYLYSEYENASQDIYTAFVDRFSALLLPNGRLGVISSRLGFFQDLTEAWRRRLLHGEHRLAIMADLGEKVLDDALVETAAYIVGGMGTAGVFIDTLGKPNKGEVIRNAVFEMTKAAGVHLASLFSFDPVPKMRIVYWCSPGWRLRFRSESTVRATFGFPKVGLQTGDDKRMLRLLWEIPAAGTRWVAFAKGGEYSPVFLDLHLAVNWSQRDAARRLSNPDGYFKQGVTFTERTASDISFRILPPGCVFSPNGVTIAPLAVDDALFAAALLNTRVARMFVEMCVGGGDSLNSGGAARHYGPNIVACIPLPPTDDKARIAHVNEGTRKAWRCLADLDSYCELSPYFRWPFPVPIPDTIRECAEAHLAAREGAEEALLASSALAEQFYSDGLSLSREESEEIDGIWGRHPEALPEEEGPSAAEFKDAYLRPIGDLIDEEVARRGASRALTKCAYIANRKLEILAVKFGLRPSSLIRIRRQLQLLPSDDVREMTERAISFAIGAAYGRWDARGPDEFRSSQLEYDPGRAITCCPPAMLAGNDALPAQNEPSDYPLQIRWNGVLVDDPDHRDDVVRASRELLSLCWGQRLEVIESEACETLGVKGLRDYFRKPAGFFADHLSRYSKSRRQAPIYWPLSTTSGSYTLWVYYHRLTDQMLYACVNLVQQKLNDLERDIARLRDEKRTKDLQVAVALHSELEDFKQELLVWAPRWKPNLNDGVLITACPLWKLFRLPKWRRDLEACWKELEAGNYDWAHLAYSLWPDRVREKCKKDRSLAIAHGLEDICEVEPPKPKKATRGRGRRSGSGRQMELGGAEDSEELDA